MKIKFLPYQPHSLTFGGFEVQMLSTFDALIKEQVNVEKLDVWSRDSEFDVLHCWGLDLSNYENVKWGKKKGYKVVVTALIGYMESSFEVTKFYISRLAYKQRLVQEMIEHIDTIVVVNDLQKEVLVKHYKVPADKIVIIPNSVSDIFFESGHLVKNSDYVLTVGNVGHRKNQLLLAKACSEAKLKLVVIGKPVPGEEAYCKEFSDFIENDPKITWIKGLKENSPELLKYYLECSMFALPSFIEQQPISILEAASLGKPILTSNKAYGRQNYYENSKLVDPSSLESIKHGLLSVLSNPTTFIPPHELLENCRGTMVGKAYKNMYESLINYK